MKPIILQYAVTRKLSGFEVPLSYNHKMGLSTTILDNEEKVFIHLDKESLRLNTRTKVKNEGDEINESFLQMTTKTLVKQERDDDENSRYIQ